MTALAADLEQSVQQAGGVIETTLNPPPSVEETRMQRTRTLSPGAETLMQQVNQDLDWVAEHEGELLRQYEGEGN